MKIITLQIPTEDNPDFPDAIQIPATTKLEPEIETPSTTPVVGRKATRAWNLKNMHKKRDEEALVFRRKINRRVHRGTVHPEAKRRLLQRLFLLRPSLQFIKALYLRKGESLKNVKLLVNAENYEHLPQVKITAEAFDELHQMILALEVNR